MPRPSPAVRALKPGILFLAACLAATQTFAQDPDPAQLKALERDLQQSESESQRLAREAAKITADVERLRGEAIALAKEIQDQEYSLLVMENRIAEMEASAAEAGRTLERRDAQMREALLALQRLALRPGDALTLNPLSPDDAVRTAILLRAAMPNIKQSSNALAAELTTLYRVRAQVTEQREAAAASAAALVEKRKRMETTLTERAAQQQKIALRSDEATARTQKLAQEAEDLRALFARLAEEKARRDAAERNLALERAAAERAEKQKAAADAKAKAPAEKTGQKPGETQVARVAPVPPKSAPDELAVTRSFAKARGTLPYPVAGTLSARFGEAADPADSAGLRTKGITIKAPAGAQVIAPFDGVIAFAGPFRGYGQLLIIEHSEGYHTLLAGLGRIDGEVGSRVLAGEPVGVMASVVTDETAASSLYVELRRDGQPINPLPWLADRTGKVARR
ncbi:MAG: murein hydrolase activator EnvC [Rhodospirillaceae bacterium]